MELVFRLVQLAISQMLILVNDVQLGHLFVQRSVNNLSTLLNVQPDMYLTQANRFRSTIKPCLFKNASRLALQDHLIMELNVLDALTPASLAVMLLNVLLVETQQ